MNRIFKWFLIIAAALVVLIIAALVIIPQFVNLNHFKPQIEKQVTQMTGRPFTLGGQISLSLFPWAGVALEDIHLGNPPGFNEKDFISAKEFEVRVKLIPLLSKNIEVERFVLDTPRIVLAKNKQGRVNWEGLAEKAASDVPPSAEPKEDLPPSTGGLPIESLDVGEFNIKNGSLLYLDEKAGSRNEINELNLNLENLSLDRPILIGLSAKLDGKPLTMKGQVGPVGREIGSNPVPVDLKVEALQDIKLKLKGQIENLKQQPEFALQMDLETFSPRKLIKALGQDFPIQTSDAEALSRLSLAADIQGTPELITISNGLMKLDDSTIRFSLQVKDFDKPNLVFVVDLDRINADSYLPPETPASTAKKGSETKTEKPATKKTDYGPLRKPVLSGTLLIGELKIKGAEIRDLSAQVKARNGRYTIDPILMKLYGGSIAGNTSLDVQGSEPRTSADLQLKQIQVNPLMVNFVEKDILEGTLDAGVALSMTGDDPERIKSTLDGKGRLHLSDGAVKGIDLAGMVRNVKATFGLAEKSASKPRTDFSELNVPFTLSNGLFATDNTSLASPFLRLTASGTADLAKEKLDFRVEPKLVKTIKGQGDTEERSGLTVPILVSGSFSDPSFRPDLEGAAKKKLEEALTDPRKFKESLKKDKESLKSLEDQGKELLKGLRFGK